MTGIFKAGMACMLMSGMVVAASQKGLPSWEGGQPDAAEWIAGDALLAGDPAAEQGDATGGEAMEFEQPAAGEIIATESGLSEVPEAFWPDYFAERPKAFLVDPQNLLSPVDKRERLEFLKYHASDSSIDLFVYVFGGDQEIPGEVRQEELAERLFSQGRPAAIILYFMGAPERAVLYMSPSLTEVVPAAERRRALESSVMQALAKMNPAGQFEAFLVQMSIRVYWIERMTGGGEEHVESLAVISGAPVVHERKSRLMALVGPHLDSVRHFAMPAGGAAGGLLLLLALRAWLKWRARYRFPDFEVEPRLGGAHAAGVGGVISFASATVPPASQRDQAPDYLRRA